VELKDILVIRIWACLLSIVSILGLVYVINICQTEPNNSMTASSIYQASTPTTTDMRISPLHFDLLSNAMAIICEKTEDHINDTLCLNVPVYDTTLGKKAKLKITKYPEVITETFHPYDNITLPKGTYSVQFEMSIFRHVKYENATDGSFHYGVTLKLDEEPLVRCIHGLLGNSSSSEIENCSFISTPVQKYTIDLDDIFTYVKSSISVKIPLSIEKSESNLTLMFGNEGFVDKGTLIVAMLH